MKEKFTSIDTASVVSELREKLVGLRVVNVYDLNKRVYSFKLAKPGFKIFLLIESGVRIHSSSYLHEHKSIPSVFVMKLRKALKSKRIEAITQVGIDRVIDIRIGSGEVEKHLIVELHSMGNIFLTSPDYKIEALLRNFEYEEDVKVAVDKPYPLHLCRHLPPAVDEPLIERKIKEVEERIAYLAEHPIQVKNKRHAKRIQKVELSLLCVLDYCVSHIGYALCQYAFYHCGIEDPTVGLESLSREAFVDAIAQAGSYILQLFSAEQSGIGKGYILYAKNHREDKPMYDIFTPILQKHQLELPMLVMDSFDEAVDKYFSEREVQRLEYRKEVQKETVLKKVEYVRKDQERRVENLKQNEVNFERKAFLIQHNAEVVDEAILILRSEIAKGVQWQEIDEVVKEAQKNGDEIANMIHSIDFEKSTMEVLLTDPFEEGNEEDMNREMEVVKVDIEKGAYANARDYFSEKKKSAIKAEKTKKAASKAVKAAEVHATSTMKMVEIKDRILKLRKQLWFEKFHWFISSENYVVIAGRDIQQNELIVKRYLRKNDIYIHADIHGAPSIVVKNPGNTIIPPLTLSEAGNFAVCLSGAWKRKFSIAAYWVYSHQVSKSAPSGEYLPTGSFMIRGKKNFIQQSTLQLGFGLLFRVDDGSVVNHEGERVVRSLDEDSKGVLMEERIRDSGGVEDEEVHVENPVLRELFAAVEKGQKQGEKKAGKERPKPQVVEKKKAAPPPRKKKKVKAKYRDQDDEERELRQRLIGHTPKEEVVEEEKVDEEEERKQERKKRVEREKTAEELALIAEQENLKALEEEKKQDEVNINALTGQPKEVDTVLYAVPVLAPYSVMNNYTYKVKVIPGSTKAGKAAKAALSYFTHIYGMSDLHKEIIRAIPDTEVNLRMIRDVKVVLPRQERKKR